MEPVLRLVVMLGRLVVMSWCSLVYNGIETVMFIGSIVNGTNRSIGLHQRVLTFHRVTFASLMLRFYITGVEVIDAVFESVFGWSLLQYLRIKPLE